MCGIAGVMHRGESANIGHELTLMLQALKHRGPDSAGLALYGEPKADQYIMRFKVAEQEDVNRGFDVFRLMEKRKGAVDERMAEMDAEVESVEKVTEYTYRYVFRFDGDLRRFANYVEDIEDVEILSIGHSLELIKDLGDADLVSTQYRLSNFEGTHAIGHTRMATESDVDIRSAHPYWAYPFSDVSVVHNGQLTNYWNSRRALERRGHRFMSNCDSELIAVYLADQMDRAGDLNEAMHRSISELDGVFTYMVATQDKLGIAKDVMAAKPLVLYESDALIALASEEIAIRSIFPHEIDTYDPYEGEVRVWNN